MKQDKQPVPRREFDLDFVDLHSDVSVDRFKVEEKSRKGKKGGQNAGRRNSISASASSDSNKGTTSGSKNSRSKNQPPSRRRELFFSALLNLILAIGLGYLMWEREMGQEDYAKRMDSLKNDLSEQTQTLKEANDRIQELEGNNQKLEKKGDTLSTKGKNLSSDFEKQKKEAILLRKEITSLKKKNQDQSKKLKSTQKRHDRLKSESKKKENELQSTLAEVRQREQENEANFQAQLTSVQEGVDSLRNERNSLHRRISGYEAQIEEEAQAGKAAMREQGNLLNENRTLKASLSKLEKKNKQLLRQNKDLKEVTTGELIPFSSDIVMPVPHYKEPIPKGVKFPKGTNFVVVHMLINESGAVTEIFYPQGQFIETTFKSIMSPNLFKWKFSPPKYRNMNVKCWIPVIIRKP